MLPESFGNYALLAPLGSGGMAEVFLARTQSLAGFEKLLAIKRLLPYYTEDQETVDLLADEARITVRLTHPNIVQVFDFGRVQETYFIAMEYVDGLDLKSLIRIDELSSTPMEVGLALYVVVSVLDALEFAHQASLGIIHRDVSPHNVLISRYGEVKLTDFGVARAEISCHVSRVGDIRGKFSYMPPEQLRGGDIDHRVDIFAVGAILYELLSGRQPYRSSSVQEQLHLLRSHVQPPSAFRPGLPRELDAICLRALDRDPAGRYGTAGELATALREESVRLFGVTLPPTGPLAELVETRLSLLREARPAREATQQLMARADYNVTENSLIRLPIRRSSRRGDRSPSSGGAAGVTPDPRLQSPSQPSLPIPDGLMRVGTEPMEPPALLTLVTDQESLIPVESAETTVSQRPPTAGAIGSLSAPTPSPAPGQQVAAPAAGAKASTPSRSGRHQVLPEPDDDHLPTVVSPSPFPAVRQAPAPGPAAAEAASISTRLPQQHEVTDEVPPAAPLRSRRALTQVIIVLAASFVLGVVLAVSLATC